MIATARDVEKAPGLQALLQTNGKKSTVQVVTLDVADAASIKVRTACSHLCAPANARCDCVLAGFTGCAGRSCTGFPDVAPGAAHALGNDPCHTGPNRCSTVLEVRKSSTS